MVVVVVNQEIMSGGIVVGIFFYRGGVLESMMLICCCYHYQKPFVLSVVCYSLLLRDHLYITFLSTFLVFWDPKNILPQKLLLF